MDDQMKLRWKEAKERIANAYHDYGRLCAAHPRACLSMSLLTMIVLSYPTIARLRLPVSTPIDVFWSEHLHVNDKTAPSWINENPASYIQQFIVSTTIEPWNATQMAPEQTVRAAVASAFRIRHILLAEPSVEELCLRLSTQRQPSAAFRSKSFCVILSPATIWYNDVQRFKEDDDAVKTIFNEQCKTSFCMRDLLLGAPVSSTGIKQNYQTNRKRNIEFAITIFFARYSRKVISGIKEMLGKEFELVEIAATDERTFVQVYFHPLKTLSDYIPLISTYFVCMLYIYYSTRKFTMVASRWGLAFASCFTVASTLLMTTGICAHLDLSTTTWGSEVYPYIALIMGLENTLCITRSVVYTPPSLDVSSRVAHGLSQEGYKLTKYYILELFALLIGFLTRVSDIQEFCQFSVICITVDFYMQLFFYAPCLTFDLERLGSEEKRKFSEMLLYEDIPRLKNYAPVSCPMRKVWPQLFALKKMQKRRLSEPGLDVFKDQEQRRLLSVDSKDDGDVRIPKADESARMKIMYFITRTRIVQRTILVVFAIWTVWLAFFVGTRQLGVEKFLSNQSIESLTHSHRILSTANLQYGIWQRRTYKWWPAVAHEYNISLNSRYVTFLPPIVINAQIEPNHKLMEKIEKTEQQREDTTHASDAPILRSRIDWLEMQLKVYLAAFWLLLLTTVISFFAYVFLGDRWKMGKGKKNGQEQEISENKNMQSSKNFVKTLPVMFSGHRFPIEAVAVDEEDSSTFASCCQEGIVYLWNVQTGQRALRLNRLKAAPEQGKDVPVAPKVWALAKRGDIIVLGCCDGSVEIGSISRNKLIGIYTQSTVGVSHVVLKTDEQIAVVRLDGTVDFLKVAYETSTEKLRIRQIEHVKTVRAHQKPICRVVTFHDQLITSSFDRSIKMWNWKSGEMSNVFLSHNSPVINLAVDEKNGTLFSSCEEGIVCWWNLETGELIRSVDNNCNWAFQLATSSDYLLGFYGSFQLFMWSVENGQLACRITDASNDGSTEDTLYSVGSSGVVTFHDKIAATTSSNSVTFWDLQHRAIIGKVKLGGKIGSMRRLTSHSVLCGVDNSMYSVTVPSVRFK